MQNITPSLESVVLLQKKITFIGSGNMGEALMSGLINAKLSRPENIIATDILQSRLDSMNSQYHIRTSQDNQKAVSEADIVVLCVKPQAVLNVLDHIKTVIRPEQLIVSILAGITSDTINDVIAKNNPVIRVMPNIPVVVGEGAMGLCLGEFAQEEHKLLAVQICEAVGKVQIVPEHLMDVITGLSGSGPAYIYMIIEALTDGGVMMGLPRDVALKLATQTVLGSAKLVQETNVHPAVLKDHVTTPGGTAIAAIQELERHGLRPMMIRAVETATRRATELSQILRKNNGLKNES
ncbi:pyrroline-5-carboxylate reductase [candidate division KSB1 bacterium]|nr:pyrroline-5-carboxylate reductase [candidate division KSB1 bacterium]